MVSRTVALCLDEESQRHPEHLGLEGEFLDNQSWLRIFNNGKDARFSLHNANDIDEVWVASCSDVEPINLAAALKHDRPDLIIKLVAITAGGSLRSRANTASIDEVLEVAAFVRLYAEKKRKCSDLLAPPIPSQRVNLPDPRITPVEATGNDVATVKESAQAANSHSILPQFMPPENDQIATPSVSEISRALDSPMRMGFLISIISGSGGSGKSVISVLAALDVAQRGYRTLLVDCDLQFGDVAYLLRTIPSIPIDLLVDNPAEQKRVCEQEAPLVVIGSPERFEASETIDTHVAGLIEDMTQYFDVVVVNTGSNWSEQHAVLLEKSSIVLFLIDQRSSSVRACSHALELCNRCGIATIPFRFALNRCAKNAPFAVSDITRIFPNMQVFELRDGGAEVEEFCASGNAFELRERNNAFVVSIENMVSQLLPTPDPAIPNQGAMFEKTSCRRRRSMRNSRRHSKVAL